MQRLDLAGAQRGYALLLSVTNKPLLLAAAQFLLGIIEQRGGNPQAAIELYSSALATDKRNPQITLQLGLAHFALAQMDEAECCYRTSITLEPRMAHAHYNLGVLLQQKRDLPGACRAFEAALMVQPRFPEALNNLGNMLMALREFPRSEQCYRDAIAINKNFSMRITAWACCWWKRTGKMRRGTICSSAYVEQLAATNSLRVMTREKKILRSEYAQPVHGYLFIVEKKIQATIFAAS